MDWLEFFSIKFSNFPEDIIKQCKLWEKVYNKGFVYVKCICGVYVLPQEGIISQKLLEEHIDNQGYRQSDKTPGFWKQDTRLVNFTIIFDDLGVKYVGKKHANHLINVMKKH